MKQYNEANDGKSYSEEVEAKVLAFLDLVKYVYIHHPTGLAIALIYWNEQFSFMDFVDPTKPVDELTYESVREDNFAFLSVFVNEMLAGYIKGDVDTEEYKDDYDKAKEFIEAMIAFSRTEEFLKFYNRSL